MPKDSSRREAALSNVSVDVEAFFAFSFARPEVLTAAASTESAAPLPLEPILFFLVFLSDAADEEEVGAPGADFSSDAASELEQQPIVRKGGRQLRLQE
mmetsp:Transcript_9940/g.36371  ORF Transcript_9940/g.36371 Transcript_9940/m.36371 type:complete len:99 (-) Transcript_9940:55-351(-)